MNSFKNIIYIIIQVINRYTETLYCIQISYNLWNNLFNIYSYKLLDLMYFSVYSQSGLLVKDKYTITDLVISTKSWTNKSWKLEKIKIQLLNIKIKLRATTPTWRMGYVRPPAENSWNLEKLRYFNQILQIKRLEINFYASSMIL